MQDKPRVRLNKNRVKELKKRLILSLVFVPAFLIAASFFMLAAAKGNSSARAVDYWNDNRDEIMQDYADGELMSTDVAGIIQFDENNVVPFYFDLENVEESASLFGHILPGQTGRSVILGQNEQGFVYLSKIKVGDKIVVDSYEGKFVYVVTSTMICVPAEIPLHSVDESVLTLVTQYPFRTLYTADRRYVVEAVRDS